VVKNVFKMCYKRKIVNLLYCVIYDNVDMQVPSDCITCDPRLVTNFKTEMNIVRNLSTSWDNMTQTNIIGDDSVTVFISKVIKTVCENDKIFDIAHALTMYAYIVDICTNLLSEKKDHNDVCEIVEIVCDYMIEKDVLTCIRFLGYLGSL
ncbi:MAG: hypothetical protein ACRC6N_06770, partial [Plesiomonas sp.]|uniref:hypothetical protein n=1 Tax=Plesiomonas sp. TaxID=2486279 RepID=UPI003F3DA2F3